MHSDRHSQILMSLVGTVGVVTLIASFMINPAPPPDATVQDILEYGRWHATTILVAGWMQGIGSMLNVVFALGVIPLAGAQRKPAGSIALLSGGSILCISLVECSLYFAAVDAGMRGDTVALTTMLTLIRGLQHVFLIAPALLLPVGWALLHAAILPRAFGVTGFLIGAALQILGALGVLYALQPVVDALLIVQAIWFLAASAVLGFNAVRASLVASDHERMRMVNA